MGVQHASWPPSLDIERCGPRMEDHVAFPASHLIDCPWAWAVALGPQLHLEDFGMVSDVGPVQRHAVGIHAEDHDISHVSLAGQARRWLARCRPEEPHESAVTVVAFGSA